MSAAPRLIRDGDLMLIVGAADQLGAVSTPTAPKTAADMVRWYTGIVAAVDGPMFRYCDNERQRDYARYQCGVNRFALHYPARENVAFRGETPNDGSTLYVVGGRAAYGRGAAFPANATFAAQLYPTLVYDGAVTQGLSDRDNNKRVAVGLFGNGEVFFAVHRSISMPAFAELLRQKGVSFGGLRYAGYTDGGGSAALHLDADLDNSPEFSFNTRGRRIISLITFERKAAVDRFLSSVVSGALTGTGGKVAIALAAGALAIGVGVVATRK